MNIVTYNDFPDEWLGLAELQQRWALQYKALSTFWTSKGQQAGATPLTPYELHGTSKDPHSDLSVSTFLPCTAEEFPAPSSIFFRFEQVEKVEEDYYSLRWAAAEYQRQQGITRASFVFAEEFSAEAYHIHTAITFGDIFIRLAQPLRTPKNSLCHDAYPFFQNHNIEKKFYELEGLLSLNIAGGTIQPYGIGKFGSGSAYFKLRRVERHGRRKIYSDFHDSILFKMYPRNSLVYFDATEIYSQWPHWKISRQVEHKAIRVTPTRIISEPNYINPSPLSLHKSKNDFSLFSETEGPTELEQKSSINSSLPRNNGLHEKRDFTQRTTITVTNRLSSAKNGTGTHKSLSATCSFIGDIAEGMKRVVEDMLPESAADQYGQLRLLIHGLTGIKEAAFEITPNILPEEKDGES